MLQHNVKLMSRKYPARVLIGDCIEMLSRSKKKKMGEEKMMMKMGEEKKRVRAPWLDLLSSVTGNETKRDENISNVIFFLDPPWGGLNYKQENSITLTLSGHDVFDVSDGLMEIVFEESCF